MLRCGMPSVNHVEEMERSSLAPRPNGATTDNARYLHKKFKKMAELLPSTPSVIIPAPKVAQKTEANEDTLPYISEPARQSACSPVASPSCLPNVIRTTVVTTSITASPPSTATLPEAISLTGMGGGRYVCSYCELVCNKPSVLEKHVRAHTNERPYPCLPCGLAFKTRSNLYKHCRSRSHSFIVEGPNEGGVRGDTRGNGYNSDSSEEDTNDQDDTQNDHENNNNTWTNLVTGEEERSNQLFVPLIYKPKFHKYIQNNGGKKFTMTEVEQKSVLSKLHPASNKLESTSEISPALLSSDRLMAPTSSVNGSISNAEFLQRRINKLISENEAIVETNDSFRSRKFSQHSKENVSPSSTLPIMTTSSLLSTSSLERLNKIHHPPSLRTKDTVTEERLPTLESKSRSVSPHPEFVARLVEMSNITSCLDHIADDSGNRSSGCSLVTSCTSEEFQPLNLTMNNKEVKFPRPNLLPLQPGTFVPKKLLPETVTVLPLVSPETPRSNKSYGQLYIGDNAYTYLGLKCSTRDTFCTLHKSQPTYVPLGPKHNKISMYSNWKVRSELDPCTATSAIASYDSRQRYSPYTAGHSKKEDRVTHSSYPFSRTRLKTVAGSSKDDSDDGSENKTYRSKLADSRFERSVIPVGNYDEELGDECEKENYRADDTTCELEREVAKSLLSLSEIPHQKVSEQYVTAGLVSLNTRPLTFPYNCSANMSSKPQMSTSMLISEQNERETMLKNTMLVRGLQSASSNPGETMIQEFDMPAQLSNHRYFSGSSSKREGTTKFTYDLPKLVFKDSAAVVPVFPIDLSNKNALADDTSRVSGSIGVLNTVPRSVIATVGDFRKISAPISQPVVHKTICSMAEVEEIVPPHWSFVSNKADTASGSSTFISRTQFEEDTAQDPRSPRIQLEERNFGPKRLKVYNEAFIKGEEIAAVAQNAAVTSSSYLRANPVSKSVLLDGVMAARPNLNPTHKNHFVFDNNDAEESFLVRYENSDKLRFKRVSDSDSKENCMLASMNSVVNSGYSSASIGNAVTNNVAKKLKTEFIAPTGGPLPEYAIMLEDGRSKCVVCNKIFSKLSQLLLHVNIHYFEQPFRCEPCAVSFRTKGHLQKHLGSTAHSTKMSMNSKGNAQTLTSDPRPYKCGDCNLGFRIHGHLAKHLRSKLHIMKLECLGKLPFGTYTEIERCGISLLNDIETTDYEKYLEHLQRIAKGIVNPDS